MQATTKLLASALATLLSGCFASDRPMFAPDAAVRVLGDGGQYATFEQDQGQEKPGDPIEVRARPGNVYDFINEKGHATPVTFHALPNGEHVAQVKLEGEFRLRLRAGPRHRQGPPGRSGRMQQAGHRKNGDARRRAAQSV